MSSDSVTIRLPETKQKHNYRKYISIYMLLIPGLLYFIIFRYLPMAGLIMAFKDISLAQGIAGVFTEPFVGLRHFERFFNSPFAGRIIFNTLYISFGHLIFGFPAPIILAILLSELRNRRVQRVIQTVSYLPHFISWVVAAGIITSLLTINGGLFAEIAKLLGREPPLIIGNADHFVKLLITSNLWKTVGFGSIIYLAAITSIDTELYEAARIDGANRIQMIFSITLPSISFIAAMMFILQFATILDAGFEQILLLYSEPTRIVGDVIDTYVYRVGLQQMEYSFATAVGLFKSVIALFMVLIVNTVVKKFGYASIW